MILGVTNGVGACVVVGKGIPGGTGIPVGTLVSFMLGMRLTFPPSAVVLLKIAGSRTGPVS